VSKNVKRASPMNYTVKRLNEYVDEKYKFMESLIKSHREKFEETIDHIKTDLINVSPFKIGDIVKIKCGLYGSHKGKTARITDIKFHKNFLTYEACVSLVILKANGKDSVYTKICPLSQVVLLETNP
jgi:hypothetical protein